MVGALLHDAATSEIFADVVEFLQYHGFARTLQELEAERSAALSAKQSLSAAGSKEHSLHVRDMMKAFDSGDRERFFFLWRQVVPLVFLQSHDWAVKLEFGLHVHFALFPLIVHQERASRDDISQRMVHFKQYIETKGSAMAHHPDFLVYFALPHVLEPERHPSFQHLLDPQCMTAQRAQLEIFLSMLPRQDRKPRLYAVMQAGGSNRHTEQVQTAREFSTQVTSVAQKDLQRLLKGEADIEEFVEPSGHGGASNVAAAKAIVPTDPPFNAIEKSSSTHARTQHDFDAQNQGLNDEPAPLDKEEGQSAAACDHQNVQEDTEAVSDATVTQNKEYGISKTHAHTEIGAVKPETERLASEGNDALGGSERPQETQDDAPEKDSSHHGDSSSPGIAVGPESAATGQPVDSIPAKSSSGEGKPSLLNPSCNLEEPEVCSSLDMTRVSQRQCCDASEVAVSKAETVTHTSLQQAQLPPLDWETLKEHLVSRDTGFQARLLQAIRWRLIKAPVGPDRQGILAMFAHYDILECSKATAQSGLVSTLASTNDVGLMMELVRLMSVLASDSAGRAYLLQSQSMVISELHKILISAPSAMLHIKEGDHVSDTNLQQHALAALQKLSLRRSAQEALVQCQMVPWTVEFLRKHESLSEHAVEYSLATLMNMCLCRSGRQACEGLEVFDVLDGLIQDSNLQVRTYVHGTYYSLLSRKHFQDLAHERGLVDMLMAVSKTSDPVFQNQIGHILSHMTEESEDDSAPELVNAQDDLGIDTMEYEDEFDEIQGVMSSGRLVGEELLQSEYTLPESAAADMKSFHVHASSMEVSRTGGSSLAASGPFSRPVTPINRSLSKRHVRGKGAGGEVTQSDSALTMRARARKAALNVPGNPAIKEEYVNVFAGRELARTPPSSTR